MKFEKYGNENGKTIMLIHGMATTGHDYRLDITDNIKQFKGDVIFMHGSNEPFPKKSLARLKTYLPNIESQVIDKMGHGQFLYENPEKYAETIQQYIK